MVLHVILCLDSVHCTNVTQAGKAEHVIESAMSVSMDTNVIAGVGTAAIT